MGQKISHPVYTVEGGFNSLKDIKAAEIRFIKVRLKFDVFKNSAPFPSAIIVFKPKELPPCPNR